MLYINHSGKYIEINFNMKIPLPNAFCMGISASDGKFLHSGHVGHW